MGFLSKLLGKKIEPAPAPTKAITDIDVVEKNPNVRIIKSSVAELSTKDTQEKFAEVIKGLDDVGYFKNKYDGLATNKDLIAKGQNESEYWEFGGAYLPFIGIEPDPDSEAISVFIGKSEKDLFEIGHLAEKDLSRIHSAMKKNKLVDVKGRIYGGKYKMLTDDDKVKTGSKKYTLYVTLTFEKIDTK